MEGIRKEPAFLDTAVSVSTSERWRSRKKKNTEDKERKRNFSRTLFIIEYVNKLNKGGRPGVGEGTWPLFLAL